MPFTHDLSVAEYKVQQELQNLQKVESKKRLLETSVDSASQKLTNLKLQNDEMNEEIQSELTDKKKKVESLDTQLETKKLVLEITDEELKQFSHNKVTIEIENEHQNIISLRILEVLSFSVLLTN